MLPNFELDLRNTAVCTSVRFHDDILSTSHVIVLSRLQKWVFGYNLATDNRMLPNFEHELSNTALRTIVKFHPDKLSSSQIIVLTNQ
jgi:hypothetical protein